MADNFNAEPLSAGATTWLPGGAAAATTSSTTHGQYADGVGGATSSEQYWLPIWSGEILHAYDQYNMFEPLVTTRNITSGTTMRFPITGTVGHQAVWSAGEELNGNGLLTDAPGYFDISLDQRPMASYFELDDISLMLTQWEYRSEIARQAGLSLANARDKQIACLIAQGAFMPSRSPAVSQGGNFAGAASAVGSPWANTADTDMTSSTIYDMEASAAFNALGNTTADVAGRTAAALKLLEYIERYMVRLQQIDAPTEGVYCSVTPQAFQDIRALGIARSTTAEAANMQPMFGGVAAAGGLGAQYSQGLNTLSDSLVYMGCTIIKTNHMPEQTVQYSAAAADWTTADTGTATLPDDDIANVIFNASDYVDGNSGTKIGGTPADTGIGKTLRKIHDLGDAKYDFDWVGFAADGVGGTTITRMHPVKALMWQKDAVASLSLQGLKVNSIEDIRRNTHFTVASVMRGGGVLRPELCAAICGYGQVI